MEQNQLQNLHLMQKNEKKERKGIFTLQNFINIACHLTERIVKVVSARKV